MNLSRIISNILIISLLLILQACGGDKTNGSVVLAVDKSSVGTGSTLAATVTVTSPNSTSFNNLQVSILSDNTDVIPNASGTTNNAGVANIVLQPLSVITTQKTVNLVAVVGGVRSLSVPVTVTTPTLTLSPMADGSFAATGLTNTEIHFVPQNLKVTFKDSLGNPVQNQDITLSVDVINNQAAGDVVVFSPPAGNQVTAPPGTITVATDSSGAVSIPAVIHIVTPSVTGSQRVITVIWKASAGILGQNKTPLTFTEFGATQFTVTN
jgi:hypothetical protein